jgi:hypothetical protein
LYKKDYYNFDLGATYNYSDDLSFSIKGVNLFDKAPKMKYPSFDMTTLQPTDSLNITPFTKEVLFKMEYRF